MFCRTTNYIALKTTDTRSCTSRMATVLFLWDHPGIRTGASGGEPVNSSHRKIVWRVDSHVWRRWGSAKDIRWCGRDSLNALEAGDAVRSSMLSLISSVWAKNELYPITHLQHNSLSVVRQYTEISQPCKMETTKIMSSHQQLTMTGVGRDRRWFGLIHSLFAPRSKSANKTPANSLPGPLAPWNLRSQERNGPGIFVPLVHDVDTRYSNYTLLLMRTFSIECCGTHGLSQTVIRRPCSG